MAIQTVVSRNHKTTSSVTAAAEKGNERGAGPTSIISSPTRSKSKTRRMKRSWSDFSVVSKFFLLGLGCWILIVLTDINRTAPLPGVSSDSNKTNNNPQPGEPRLRPAYLTDEGTEISDMDSSADYMDSSVDDTEEVSEESTHAPEGEKQQKVRLRARRHKIPRILIFTHYKNLLELEPSKLLGRTNNDAAAAAAFDDNAHIHTKHLTTDEIEEFALAANIRHSIDIHNRSASATGDDNDNDHHEREEPEVLFWTDEDCIRSLQRTRPKLVSYFKNEKEGMYKADICRGTALLEHGGFYLDVDVGVRQDLWHDLLPETEFVTVRVHGASKWKGEGFFQAILGASPRNPVIKRYLELFEKHYDGTDVVKKGPLGVLLLKRAWDQIQTVVDDEENVLTELYQEIQFQKGGPFDDKGFLSPAPTWGKRRACHFLVAGVANYPSGIEAVLSPAKVSGDGDPKQRSLRLKIPALSRIPGSRMCVESDAYTNAADGSYNNTRLIESMKWWERT